MKIGNGVRLSGLGVVVLAVVAVASCDRGTEATWTDESGLLRYVPADTPYLYATGDAPPDELMDKLEPWADSMLAGYQELLGTMLDATTVNAALSADERQRMTAVLDAAGELMSVAGLESAGLTRDSKVVVYGNGLLPVMRVTLTDGARLEAAVARIETAAGARAPVAASGTHSYRYWGDDEVRLVMAIVDNELVLTASPTDLAERHLRTVLGGELPADNIAASGKLEDIASKYEFGPHYLGFVDVPQLAATFLDEPAGINAELLALMEYDRSALSAVCQAEFREMANIAPRLILGYTALDAEQMAMNAVIELRQDIAAGLATILAPVPGLGTLRAGLLSFGMGVDLPAARDFAMARLNALAADPYECELLAGLAPAIPEMRAMLNQPVPPEIYDFKGFLMMLDEIGDLDLMASGQIPSEVSARLLVASDDAPGLAAMGAPFSPEVAALQPDGDPVRINLPLPLPVPLEIYAALTPTAIGVAVGPGAEARLQQLLTAPMAETVPFMSFDMDYRGYVDLLEAGIELGLAADPTATPEMMEPLRQMLGQFSEGPIAREAVDVRFTANGIEMPSTVTLSD